MMNAEELLSKVNNGITKYNYTEEQITELEKKAFDAIVDDYKIRLHNYDHKSMSEYLFSNYKHSRLRYVGSQFKLDIENISLTTRELIIMYLYHNGFTKDQIFDMSINERITYMYLLGF